MIDWVGPYPPPPPSLRERRENPRWEEEYREAWSTYEVKRDAFFYENRWAMLWDAVCWYAPFVLGWLVLVGIASICIIASLR